MFAWGEGSAGGEGEVDAAAEVPAGDVDWCGGAVGDFDPFVIRAAERLAGDGWGEERAEGEFETEDDIVAVDGVLVDLDGDAVGAWDEGGGGDEDGDEGCVGDAGDGEGFRADGAGGHGEA